MFHCIIKFVQSNATKLWRTYTKKIPFYLYLNIVRKTIVYVYVGATLLCRYLQWPVKIMATK